ncbi:ribbon-helix-helix protein, CopG family [Nocardia sp. 2]|uniref:Ribbon-helix-helix protein, CopG family n=1 Tax=Nocardia acididurans TaxID=2802282 RepID=A0ABS1LXZ8_9NOCA|nr:CopG family transcriptional regulator [Nocardia acididurans]MBL1073109.1 ribbon-helix-helix protein, CopG family [Nocardia acididurans]
MNSRPDQSYPRSAQEAKVFLDGLTFDDAVSMPALPPATDEIERGMVTTSLKLPQQTRDRVRELAAEHGITSSMLIRQYIEMGLASEAPDKMISLSDAIRVLSTLRPSA